MKPRAFPTLLTNPLGLSLCALSAALVAAGIVAILGGF